MTALDPLGCLLWWRVGDVDLDHDQLEKILAGSGIPLPARPIPIDVFRRVTGTALARHEVPGGTLELTTAVVDAPSDKMLVRHLVGTLRDANGVAQLIRKVGDAAFYKPPRGKNSKARMRISQSVPIPEWREPVVEFARQLQAEYDLAVRGRLDGQALRRLVRTHLSNIGAVFLDGPYYMPWSEDIGWLQPLEELLNNNLGEDSFVHMVPMPDNAYQRAFLARRKEENHHE